MRKPGTTVASAFAQTIVSERALKIAPAVQQPRALYYGDVHVQRAETCASPFADSTARTMLHGYDWKGALESCREVLEHDPDHLGALEVSAQALWFAGRYEEVVNTTNRLLQLNPLEPGYRYTRGMALMSMGHLGRAVDDFRQAIAQSDNPRFILQVQNALLAIEQYQNGGLDRIARMNAVRIVRKSTEFGPLTDNKIH